LFFLTPPWPIGFTDAPCRRIKAGHNSMREQAQVVSFFIFFTDMSWPS
jgi:hypothetical protein